MSNRLLSGATTWLQPSQFLPAERLPATRSLSLSSLRAAWRRYRSRQRISELDGHMLKDIGVSFAEAEAEANKPFWRG